MEQVCARRIDAGVPQVTTDETDELNQADEAFAGNRLLSTFSKEARALLEPFGELVQLTTGETVLHRGDAVSATLFPVARRSLSAWGVVRR